MGETSRINKSTETESSLEVARGWGQERRGSAYTWWVQGFFGGEEKVLEINNVIVAQPWYCTKCHCSILSSEFYHKLKKKR